MKSRRIVIRHPRNKESPVWVVDSEQWPRACLRAELIERGYDAYGFMTIRDALDSLSQRTLPRPAALILELRGQSLNEELVQAIRNLRVATILLGGNTELNDQLVQSGKWDAVLKRPVSLGKIADVAQNIISGFASPAWIR